MTLASILQPRRLSEFFGHRRIIAALRKQFSEREPHALLFIGASGCGKTTLAQVIAHSVQCTHGDFGEPCDKCLAQEYQIVEVNASEINGVQEVGDIARGSVFRPTPPTRRRVIILDEAQMLSANAQNMLLKYFEKPPETTTWIVCTTAPQKILNTLRRRCLTYTLSGLDVETREKFLGRAAKRIKCSKPITALIEQVQTHDISSPGLLLNALERFASGMNAQESVLWLGEVEFDAKHLCVGVIRGDWPAVKTAWQKTSAEQARLARASVAGYLRGALMRDTGAKRSAYARSILLLMDGRAPLDDAALHLWLTAALFQVCTEMRK